MRVEGKGAERSELVNRNSIKCYTWDVPSSAMVRTLHSHCGGAEFHPMGRGNEKFKEKFKTFFLIKKKKKKTRPKKRQRRLKKKRLPCEKKKMMFFIVLLRHQHPEKESPRIWVS